MKSSLKNVLAESQGIAVPWRQQGLIAAQLLTVGRKASKLSSIINQLFKMLPLTWHATDGLSQGLVIQHRLGWTYNPLALLSHRLGLQVWTIVFSCERFIGRKKKQNKTENRNPQLTSPSVIGFLLGKWVITWKAGYCILRGDPLPRNRMEHRLCAMHLEGPVSRRWRLNAAVMLYCSTKPSCYWVKQLTTGVAATEEGTETITTLFWCFSRRLDSCCHVRLCWRPPVRQV